MFFLQCCYMILFLSAFTQHRVALPFEMLALLFMHIIVGLIILIFD